MSTSNVIHDASTRVPNQRTIAVTTAALCQVVCVKCLDFANYWLLTRSLPDFVVDIWASEFRFHPRVGNTEVMIESCEIRTEAYQYSRQDEQYHR